MKYNYKKFWMLAAPALGAINATAKIARVAILLRVLTPEDYASFTFVIFLHGFVVTFEPAQQKIYIKNLIGGTLNKYRMEIYDRIAHQFFLTITCLGLALLFYTSIQEGANPSRILFYSLVLVMINLIYSRQILYLSMLESQKIVHPNRIIKLLSEVIFIALCAAFYNVLSVELVMFFFAVSSVTSYMVTKLFVNQYVAFDKLPKTTQWQGDVGKQFWDQVAIQLIYTLVMFIPVLYLKANAQHQDVAFYFVFAQLMQVGPLLILPVMNVLFPYLTSGFYSKKNYLYLSLSLLILALLIYSTIYYYLEDILLLWVGGSITVNWPLAGLIFAVSVLENLHILTRYLYLSSNSPSKIIRAYIFHALYWIPPMVVLDLILDNNWAIFLYPIFYLSSINCIGIRLSLMRTRK